MDDTAYRLRKGTSANAFALTSTFVHLKDLGQAATIEVGPEFWSTLDKRPELHTGRMLGAFRMEKDMPHWEMHPSGDELLVAQSGEFHLHLQDGPTDRVVELKAGQIAAHGIGRGDRVVRLDAAWPTAAVPCASGSQKTAAH